MLKFDEIGYWSAVKLDIVRDYAKAYSTILAKQDRPRLHHVYVDGFSGAGVHVSKTTGEYIPGSPLNALNIDPPFREHFLVDLNGDKVEHLRALVGDRPDVHLLQGDCNDVLLNHVFPRVRFEDYRRGLCLLDPYGLHLNWQVLAAAGAMKTFDIFLNFPIMDMNRNVLWRSGARLDSEDAARMTAFWGDESWKDVAYAPSPQVSLFGGQEMEKQDNEAIANAFRTRLRDVGGFANVPEPMPMRNTSGAIVYYLFFASQRPVAQKIVTAIFNRHRTRGA
jgi:three-Cys-motif partner protein